MNAVTTTEPRPQLTAGGQVSAMVPQTLDEAFRLAKAIAISGMAPRGMDKPEQITVAIIAGAELGLAPFQSLQSFAVVNGRPTLWGDGLMAVARAGGVKVKEWVDGEGDMTTAHCEVTRPDNGEVIARSFTVADAKKAGLWGKQGPWQSYPRRMLAMRARAYALRDGCADMLRGFQVREEVEDYAPIRDVTPKDAPNLAARLTGPAPAAEGFNAANVLGDDDIPDFDADKTQAASEEPASDEQPEALSDAGDLFPGDAPKTAQEAAKDPMEDAQATFTPDEAEAAGGGSEALLEWSANLQADLPDLTLAQINALLTSENEKANFAKLEADHPEVAKKLNAAVVARRKALAK